MKPIEELFNIHRARSGLFSQYVPGDVPYIGNSLVDNAVAGFVTPHARDKVFRFKGIVISAFCEASVQIPPFIACGRAGNGLVALEPKKSMSIPQLAHVASYINLAIRWRFSWYRQITVDRLRRLSVPSKFPSKIDFDVRAALPNASPYSERKVILPIAFGEFALNEIYTLRAGDYHSLNQLTAGNIPMVSCGDQNNGITGYFDIRRHLYANRLSIALNGSTLTAKYHPYRFAAKDDVAVCIPRSPIRLSTQLFIQAMLNRERWRYSYYRKCYMEKLTRFVVSLPAKQGKIDEDAITRLFENSPYWNFLRTRLGKTGSGGTKSHA